MDYLGQSLNNAESVSYDNATSGITATNVQDAIDEVEVSIGGFVNKPADGTTADLAVPRFTDANGGTLKTSSMRISDLAVVSGVSSLTIYDGGRVGNGAEYVQMGTGSINHAINGVPKLELNSLALECGVDFNPTVGTIDIGDIGAKWRDLHLSGNVLVDGTVDGVDIATRDGLSVINNDPSTTNAIPKFTDTSGKVIQNSGVLIDASDNMTGVLSLTTPLVKDLSGLNTVSLSNLGVDITTTDFKVNNEYVVQAPSSPTSNLIPKWNNIGSQPYLQSSGVSIDASNNISGVNNITSTGTETGSISFPKPMIELYSDTATACTNSATFVVVPFTNVKCQFRQYFDFNANGTMTYKGTMPRYFHTGCTFSATGANNNIWELCLLKNGGNEPINGITSTRGSIVVLSFSTTATKGSTAIHKYLELRTNDTVRLYARAVSGSSLTIDYMNTFMTAMPNKIYLLHPVMTSAITPSPYAVSVSSTNGNQGWWAFDGSQNAATPYAVSRTWASASSSFSGSVPQNSYTFADLTSFACEYIKIDLGSIKTIVKYRLYHRVTGSPLSDATCPATFRLRVSTTDLAGSFTDISTVTSNPWAGNTSSTGEFVQYTVSPTSVRYVYLIVTSIISGVFCTLGQVELYGQ